MAEAGGGGDGKDSPLLAPEGQVVKAGSLPRVTKAPFLLRLHGRKHNSGSASACLSISLFGFPPACLWCLLGVGTAGGVATGRDGDALSRARDLRCSPLTNAVRV